MVYGDSVIDDIIECELYQKEEANRLTEIYEKKIFNIPGITYQDKLDTLNKCTCCNRHQIDRPNVLDVWHELPPNYIRNSRHQCTCYCRQDARLICRYVCGYTIYYDFLALIFSYRKKFYIFIFYIFYFLFH